MAEHNELGKNGENLAVEFLEGKGYQIIARIGDVATTNSILLL
jgi:Holliday junction resolvase-like predicted endonuclease